MPDKYIADVLCYMYFPSLFAFDCKILSHCYLCRRMEEQKPKEQRPKANENKPVMNE